MLHGVAEVDEANRKREEKEIIISYMEELNKHFSVYSIEYIDTHRTYQHWSVGLNMIIKKDGVTMRLNSDEIQQVVKALPKTVGGVLDCD